MTTITASGFSERTLPSEDDQGLHGRKANHSSGHHLSTSNSWGGVASMPAGSITSMPLIR